MRGGGHEESRTAHRLPRWVRKAVLWAAELCCLGSRHGAGAEGGCSDRWARVETHVTRREAGEALWTAEARLAVVVTWRERERAARAVEGAARARVGAARCAVREGREAVTQAERAVTRAAWAVRAQASPKASSIIGMLAPLPKAANIAMNSRNFSRGEVNW